MNLDSLKGASGDAAYYFQSKQFGSLLESGQYQAAAVLAKQAKKFDIPSLIKEVIARAKPELFAAFTPVLEALIVPDVVQPESCGLKIEWLHADSLLYAEAVNTYHRALKNKSLSIDQVQQALLTNLDICVTYNRCSVAQIQAWESLVHNFDPRMNRGQMWTCLEGAELVGKNPEVIAYLKSLSSESPQKRPFEKPVEEPAGIVELQGEFSEEEMRLTKRGAYSSS